MDTPSSDQIPASAGAGTVNPFAGLTFGVTVDGVSKSYDGNMILHDINLTVKPGEIFCIMGPSGSGKTVLLKQIVGLEKPTKGKVAIDEFDASDPETRAKVHLGFVF